MLSQFRCDILPLRVETGWYIGEPVGTRTCKFCSLNTVENEEHFLLNCELYDIIWHNAYGNLTLQTEFTSLSSDIYKLASTYLMNTQEIQ